MNIPDLLHKIDGELQKIEDEEKKEAALQRLLAIAKVYNGEDAVLKWPDIVVDFAHQQTPHSTGWTGLDTLLRGGFRPQHLVVLSALTKSGKTSFVLDMTSKMADLNPLWFPFEEGVEELSEKFKDRGEELPNFFHSPQTMKRNNLPWLEEKVVEGIAKYNSKIVVIDHLGFIVPSDSNRHDLLIEDAMRFLKDLARKWNIVVVLMCHLKKAKMDTQPTLEDLRGSAAIAQEADTVILMWREAKRDGKEMVVTNNVNVSVQAARRGKPGNVKMVFNNERFLEEDWMLSAADKDFNEKW